MVESTTPACKHPQWFASDRGVRCWNCYTWMPTSTRNGRTVDFQHRGDRRYTVVNGVLVVGLEEVES